MELFGSRIAPCKGGRTGESLVTTRMNRSSEGITRIRCFEIIAGESGSARATESVTLRINYLFRQLGFPVVWYMALPKMPREMFGSPTRMPASFEYPPQVKFKRFSWKAWDVKTCSMLWPVIPWKEAYGSGFLRAASHICVTVKRERPIRLPTVWAKDGLQSCESIPTARSGSPRRAGLA